MSIAHFEPVHSMCCLWILIFACGFWFASIFRSRWMIEFKVECPWFMHKFYVLFFSFHPSQRINLITLFSQKMPMVTRSPEIPAFRAYPQWNSQNSKCFFTRSKNLAGFHFNMLQKISYAITIRFAFLRRHNFKSLNRTSITAKFVSCVAAVNFCLNFE